MENNQKPEKMGFFSKLINSMMRSEAYVQLKKESFGKAVIYLLLVSLIVGLATTARYVYDYNRTVVTVIQEIGDRIPDFQIANGELSVDSKMPIKIDGGTGTEVIYIDTTVSNAEIENISRKYQTGIFANKEEMIQKQIGRPQQTTFFSEMQGVTLTKDNIIGFMGVLKAGSAFIIVGYPICFFVGKFVSGFVVALIALIINAIFIRSKANFGEIYKLAFYALTLSMILKAVSILINIEIPFFRWSGHFDYLYYVLGAVYLCLGLRSIRHHEEALEPEEY